MEFLGFRRWVNKKDFIVLGRELIYLLFSPRFLNVLIPSSSLPFYLISLPLSLPFALPIRDSINELNNHKTNE